MSFADSRVNFFSGFIITLYFAEFIFLFIALFAVYDVLPYGVTKNNNYK